MARNPYSSELYKMSSLISMTVGRKDPFFQETALMEIKAKRAYAMLYAIRETELLNVDLSTLTDDEIITKILMPILMRMGQANFKCDVLTNLGFKASLDQQQGDFDME